MSARRDYYYRQLVTEAELDAGFSGLEDADRALMVDMGVFGVTFGGGVAQNGSPNLTVNVAGPMGAYDQLGQRIGIASTQNKDLSVDDSNASTTVVGSGNERWVSLFAKFDRSLSDPRIDGNSNTVYFVRDESFELSVIQGAEAAAGLATRPALLTDGILLADINRTNGQTQILNADISTSRRQDYIVVGGSPYTLQRGRVKDALTDIIGYLNTIASAVNNTAAGITYAGGGAWADGTTNPSQSVEAWIDSAIAKLAGVLGSGGAAAVGCGARTAWLGGRTNTAGTTYAAIDKIITDLAVTSAGDDGAERIGAAASGNLAVGSVRSQLDELDAEKGGLALANVWANVNTMNGAASDTSPALRTTYTPSVFKLLWEIDINGTQKMRMYMNAGGPSLLLTSNAVLSGAATWSKDDTAATSYMQELVGAASSLYRRAAGAGTWGLYSWDDSVALTLSGGVTSLDGGTIDGVIAFGGDAGSSLMMGAATSFRAKFTSTPSSVTFSTTGMPSDVNVGTAFALGATSLRTHGMYTEGIASVSGVARCARNYSVS